MTQIVAAVMVKNEDIYVEQAIRNITGFCDHIIICDNYSTDQTWPILQRLAQEFKHIKLLQVETVDQAHTPVEQFAGTDTWIFGVDGDEIYDPVGLTSLRKKILAGEFDKDFVIFGNVLNCTALDIIKKTAQGHLAPPCRSMTKLYNFAVIKSWDNCPERLLGGQIIFRPGYHELLRRMYHKEHTWEESDYRCLHTVFLKRSSTQSTLTAKSRLNPADIRDYQIGRNLIHRSVKHLRNYLQMLLRHDSKYKKYHRGPQVNMDVTVFFPEK